MASTDNTRRHAGTGCRLIGAAIASAGLVAALGACSVAGPRQSPLPQAGPTLVDVYNNHMHTEGAATPPRERMPLRPADDDAPMEQAPAGSSVAKVMLPAGFPPAPALEQVPAGATQAQRARSVVDPMCQRFARLPNPDLVMYVFPHLSQGRYPVPGYLTVFPMYETVEYAMPGEGPSRPERCAVNATR